jgi:hypothetical protein
MTVPGATMRAATVAATADTGRTTVTAITGAAAESTMEEVGTEAVLIAAMTAIIAAAMEGPAADGAVGVGRPEGSSTPTSVEDGVKYPNSNCIGWKLKSMEIGLFVCPRIRYMIRIRL